MKMEPTLLDNVLKWLACVLTMAGAVLTTLAIDPANVFLLTTGGTVYLVWSLRIREWSLVVVNVALLAIYGYGTVTRLCCGI